MGSYQNLVVLNNLVTFDQDSQMGMESQIEWRKGTKFNNCLPQAIGVHGYL
jgi:hypothetical protein